jgi:hypothetical protein
VVVVVDVVDVVDDEVAIDVLDGAPVVDGAVDVPSPDVQPAQKTSTTSRANELVRFGKQGTGHDIRPKWLGFR